MPGDIRKFFEPAGPAAKKKQEEVELAPGGGDTRKCSQSISHAQKPRDRHQNQVCSMLWTQVAILANLDLAKIAQNGHFGHSGQSGVSGNGLNRFPMPKNLGIDTKIKSLTCSEPKLQFKPFYPN